jgi:hypothetical protein
MTTHFCDGIKEVTIFNGVARIEFHRLENKGGGRPSPEVQPVVELVLAMPTQGFLQALTVLEQVRDQMIKEGVLKSVPPEAGQQQPAPAAPTRSPNFS